MCKIWDIEAIRQFSNPMPIFITTKEEDQAIIALGEFFVKKDSQLKVILSLFPINWMGGILHRKFRVNKEYDTR